jgi:hypothetical protein
MSHVQAKITKHGKMKTDKDEIENILLKHVFTSQKKKGPMICLCV